MMLFREICKNFDEMAGRLGEIPDETKELVELQRLILTIDQLNWIADTLIQVCFSISQRALFTPLMHCTVLTPIFKTIPPYFYLMTVFYGHNWHLIIHHFQPHPTPHLLTWWLGRYLQTCMKETVPALMKRIAIATQRVGLTITVALET